MSLVKMSSYWVRQATGVRTFGYRQTENTIGRDTGEIWTSRSRGEKPGTCSSLTVNRKNQPCKNLDIGLLASKTVRI